MVARFVFVFVIRLMLFSGLLLLVTKVVLGVMFQVL